MSDMPISGENSKKIGLGNLGMSPNNNPQKQEDWLKKLPSLFMHPNINNPGAYNA